MRSCAQGGGSNRRPHVAYCVWIRTLPPPAPWHGAHLGHPRSSLGHHLSTRHTHTPRARRAKQISTPHTAHPHGMQSSHLTRRQGTRHHVAPPPHTNHSRVPQYTLCVPIFQPRNTTQAATRDHQRSPRPNTTYPMLFITRVTAKSRCTPRIVANRCDARAEDDALERLTPLQCRTPANRVAVAARKVRYQALGSAARQTCRSQLQHLQCPCVPARARVFTLTPEKGKPKPIIACINLC